jgi:hypothetical protein
MPNDDKAKPTQQEAAQAAVEWLEDKLKLPSGKYNTEQLIAQRKEVAAKLKELYPNKEDPNGAERIANNAWELDALKTIETLKKTYGIDKDNGVDPAGEAVVKAYLDRNNKNYPDYAKELPKSSVAHYTHDMEAFLGNLKERIGAIGGVQKVGTAMPGSANVSTTSKEIKL